MKILTSICCLFLISVIIEASPLQEDQDEIDLSSEIISASRLSKPEQLECFSKLCQSWYKKQPSDEKIKEIMDSLPPCRPVAPLDAQGKFPDSFDSYWIDTSCNPNGNFIARGCFFHPGAKACYRSDPPVNGHDQQCCYDTTGKLLVGPPGGGTLDMSTGFMHVFDDVLPYITCCRLSNRCDLYYAKRPSDDGSRWHPTN